MLKVGGLRFFNRQKLPNEAFVCRGGILLVVLEIHVVLLGIDSMTPPWWPCGSNCRGEINPRPCRRTCWRQI